MRCWRSCVTSRLRAASFPWRALGCAARRERCLIADGDPAHGFVHLMARIGQGRSEAIRQAQALFDAAPCPP